MASCESEPPLNSQVGGSAWQGDKYRSYQRDGRKEGGDAVDDGEQEVEAFGAWKGNMSKVEELLTCRKLWDWEDQDGLWVE